MTGGGRAAVFHGGTMIGPAFAPVAQAQGGNYTFLISLALMVGIFYFLLIRPQQRRAKQQRDLLGSLQVGDEVVTVGGMFGRITDMDDESVTLDIGAGRVRFVRQAVARKVTYGEPQGSTGEEASAGS
jgi:preprotein translocase subunit YajC